VDAGPKVRAQGRLVHDRGPPLDEPAEQVEGLGRQVDLGTVARQTPRLGLEREAVEAEGQA
jgi:hypothetical protein